MRSPDTTPNSQNEAADRTAATVVADELVCLTKALADLAYDLGSDHETLRRHMGSLQSIDLITQTQLALADFLRSEDSLESRLSAIMVESLARRMAASLHALAPPIATKIGAEI